MPDAQPKPSAAELIADHIWCAATRLGSQLGVPEMTCGAPLPPAGRDFHAAHMHERLAAAGLLVTAEHDAQVLRDADDALSVRYLGMGLMIDTDALRYRADRIAAGGGS